MLSSISALRAAALAALCVSLPLAGCPSSTDPDAPGGLSGTLDITEWASSGTISTIDLASGAAATSLNGVSPHRTPDGSVIFVTMGGSLVESNGGQERMIVEVDNDYPNTETYDDGAKNPQLSPNGRLIAYQGTVGFDVYIVDRQSGELQYSIVPVASGEGYFRPTWVSDTRLVVHGYQSNPGLHLVDLASETVERIDDNLSNPTDPIVSPDRTRVAFILDNHVWVMNLDGTGLRQVSTSPGRESMPVWSPDGRWIAVHEAAKYYAIPVEGGSPVDIMARYRNGRAVSGTGYQSSWR